MRTALCALAIALPLTAAAGPKEDASQHVANATAAHQQGQFDVALKELEAAYALDPKPELLFAIGQIQVKLGKCDVAITFYERFVATNPPAAEMAATNEAIASCKAQLAAAPPQPPPQPVPLEPEPGPPPVTIETSAPERVGLMFGAKVGGIVPLDGLSPFVHFGIELGYVLPPFKRQLAIVVAIDYTQPTTTNVESDPRVMGGTYTWRLTQQELGVMTTLMFRATSVKPVIPYGGIGPRILFARSNVRDDGAPMISTTKEQSTRLGVGIPLGIELPLGPGSGIAELLLQYGTLDHTATGDAHTGALTLALGYRMLL